MVRVAEVSRMAKRRRGRGSENNVPPQRVLDANPRPGSSSEKAARRKSCATCSQALAPEGLQIYSEFPENAELDKEIRAVLPPLKYMNRRNTEPLPWLDGDRIYVFVRIPDATAIVTFDDRGARSGFAPLASQGFTLRFALLERWISARARELFPDREVIEAFPFKIIRDADLRYRPDDEESLEEQIVSAVHGRKRARVVRLEVDASHYSRKARCFSRRRSGSTRRRCTGSACRLI